MDKFKPYTQDYGPLLQTMLDWTRISPRAKHWPRGPLQVLVEGGGTEEATFQLCWDSIDKLLVMVLTNPQQPEEKYHFVCPGGSGGIFNQFANITLFTEQRRAKLQLTYIVTHAQLVELRYLVDTYDEFEDDGEEIEQSTVYFYNDHPELAPDWFNAEPSLGIFEQTDLGDGLSKVRIWVRDAEVASLFGAQWYRRRAELDAQAWWQQDKIYCVEEIDPKAMEEVKHTWFVYGQNEDEVVAFIKGHLKAQHPQRDFRRFRIADRIRIKHGPASLDVWRNEGGDFRLRVEEVLNQPQEGGQSDVG